MNEPTPPKTHSHAKPAAAPHAERPRSPRVVFFTLVALLIAVLALVVLVFWRFLVDIGLATVMALMLKTMQQRITQMLRLNQELAKLGSGRMWRHEVECTIGSVLNRLAAAA